MKEILICAIIMIMALCLSTKVEASLINKRTDTPGNRLIYDDDKEIMLYDFTKSADIWQNQSDWADALSVYFGGTILMMEAEMTRRSDDNSISRKKK